MRKRERTLLRANVPALLVLLLVLYLVLEGALLDGNMVVALLLSVLALWSMLVATLSHPGRVRQADMGTLVTRRPDSAASPLRERAPTDKGAAAGHNPELYCRLCDAPRPPRTHHCRVCGDCVVRFDHHCLWIDNCIGAANTKAFALFIAYILLAILHFTFTVGAFLTSGVMWETLHARSHGYILGAVLVAFIPVVLFAAVVACTFAYTTAVAILHNQTTYEQQHDRIGSLRYDRGVAANVREALGPNPWLWWAPTLVRDRVHELTHPTEMV